MTCRTSSFRWPLLGLALGFGLLITSGCELEGFLDDLGINGGDPCSTSSGPVDVEGTWHLTATGSRSRCNDDRYDGDFRIPVVELSVTQTADPQDSSTDELGLGVVPDVPGGRFSLAGTVRGSCVDFTIEEDGDTGFYRFVFDGERESGDIVGELSGEGPPGCVSDGEFRISIE